MLWQHSCSSAVLTGSCRGLGPLVYTRIRTVPPGDSAAAKTPWFCRCIRCCGRITLNLGKSANLSSLPRLSPSLQTRTRYLHNNALTTLPEAHRALDRLLLNSRFDRLYVPMTRRKNPTTSIPIPGFVWSMSRTEFVCPSSTSAEGATRRPGRKCFFGCTLVVGDCGVCRL